MKKLSLLLLLFILTFSLSAQYVNTRLWRISGNGLSKSSYLYGSMHLDDERIFNFSDSVFYKLAECELFANEVSSDSVLRFIYQSFDNSLQKKLESSYFGDDDEALDEISQNTGLDKASVRKLSPVVLRQLIPGATGTKVHMPAMLDNYLYNIARREGKTCIGIEDLNTQIDLFNKYPETVKKNYTDYTIGKKRFSKNNQMVDIYRKADLAAVEEMMKLMPPDLFDAIFTQRNKGMVKQIDSISHRQSTFYTIGFGHLPGKEGLISMLRSMGYSVDPVEETFKGLAEKFPFKNNEIPWVPYVDTKSGYAVEMPGKSYSSPNYPSNVSHGLYFDMGTTNFYMAIARAASSFGSVSDMDSLTRAFAQTAWKVDPSTIKITKVLHDGLEFRQVDKIIIGDAYMCFRLALDSDNLYLLMGLNNQEKEMNDITRFFNSFHRIDKVVEGWNLFSSTKGGYEIDFPGNPKESLINNSEESNSASIGRITGSDNNTGSEYLVQYVDNRSTYYPNDTLTLSEIQKNTITTSKYDSLKSENLLFDGFPARKFSYQTENGLTMQVLLVIRGTRLYNLIAVERTGDKNHDRTDQFFSSFRLHNYQWNNWTLHESDSGFFSVISPSAFKLKTETSYSDKYTLSESYTAFDSHTADKIIVARKVFSPYYSSTCDTAFFRNYYDDVSDEADSLVMQRKISENPLTWEFHSVSPVSHLLTRMRFVLNGRSLYSLVVMMPSLYAETHPGNESINLFNVSDTTSPGDLKSDKTLQLLTDLTSADTTISYPAAKALSFYEFKNEELPLIWQCLHHSFNDDTCTDVSSREKLIRALNAFPDSLITDYIAENFDSICRNYSSEVEALSLLTRNLDPKYASFVKKQFIAIPPNTVYKYAVLSQLPDTSSYTAGMYPEILQMLNDTLNNDQLIYLTSEMLRKNVIPASVISDYRAQIFDLMKNLSENPGRLYISDYYTPRLFDIAGYFKDEEINKFLLKNQISSNKFITYNIFKSLIRNGLSFKKKTPKELAADHELRRSLYEFLSQNNKTELIPIEFSSQASIAQSDMYNYLIYEDEEPVNLIQEGVMDIMYKDTLCRFYLFSFVNEWDEEGQSYSIAGPYPFDNSIPAYNDVVETGNYWSSDKELTAAEHFAAFEKMLREEESEKSEE